METLALVLLAAALGLIIWDIRQQRKSKRQERDRFATIEYRMLGEVISYE